jgi:trehalose-6-phosphate synthase
MRPASAPRRPTRRCAPGLRKNLGAELIILAVDRLDYTKGIPERLLGYERFLERHPEWRRRAALVQITVPSPFHVPEYREMKREIEATVGRIVGRFSYEGHTPLVYLYTAFDHAGLAAYYVAADVALVTPLRDGMNLVAKEYVACHPEGDGALVLSEFAGAARELGGAVLVNPYDPEAVRRALEGTLSMNPAERRRRTRALAVQVAAHDVRWWTSTFLDLLADAGGSGCASG